MLTHKQLRAKALRDSEVQAEFEKTREEFALLEIPEGARRAGTHPGSSGREDRHHPVRRRADGVRPRQALAIHRHAFPLCRGARLQAGDPAGPPARASRELKSRPIPGGCPFPGLPDRPS